MTRTQTKELTLDTSTQQKIARGQKDATVGRVLSHAKSIRLLTTPWRSK